MSIPHSIKYWSIKDSSLEKPNIACVGASKYWERRRWDPVSWMLKSKWLMLFLLNWEFFAMLPSSVCCKCNEWIYVRAAWLYCSINDIYWGAVISSEWWLDHTWQGMTSTYFFLYEDMKNFTSLIAESWCDTVLCKIVITC